jgi:hypothetical protein
MEAFMTEKRFVQGLQRLFWVVGWVLIVVAAAGVYQTLNNGIFHFQPEPEHYLPQFKKFVETLTEGFFAFLMSTVFGMIFHREPVSSVRGERFMKITCLCYLLQAVIQVYTWFYGIFLIRGPCPDCGLAMGTTMWGLYLLVGIASLGPALYAVIIFVLYRHFTRMVKFESEVV